MWLNINVAPDLAGNHLAGRCMTNVGQGRDRKLKFQSRECGPVTGQFTTRIRERVQRIWEVAIRIQSLCAGICKHAHKIDRICLEAFLANPNRFKIAVLIELPKCLCLTFPGQQNRLRACGQKPMHFRADRKLRGRGIQSRFGKSNERFWLVHEKSWLRWRLPS